MRICRLGKKVAKAPQSGDPESRISAYMRLGELAEPGGRSTVWNRFSPYLCQNPFMLKHVWGKMQTGELESGVWGLGSEVWSLRFEV